MSQHAVGQKTPRRVNELRRGGKSAALAEHHSERNARLSELRKDGDHRRWREKLELRGSLALVLVVCAVWAAVLLSGRFSPEDKQLATSIVMPLFAGFGGYVVGTKRASHAAAD